MHSVASSSLATVPRQFIRISRRRIPRRHCTQPRSGFHTSRRYGFPEEGDKKPDGVSTSGSPRNKLEEIHEAQRTPDTEDYTELPISTVKDLANYGSAARRSRRTKSQQAVTPAVTLPEWFTDNNIHLPEDAGKSTIECLSIDLETSEYSRLDPKTLEYVRIGQYVPSSPIDSTGGETSERNEDSLAFGDEKESRYYVDASQLQELESLTQGLLKPTTEAVADDLASRKNNLVLHYAGDGGAYLLDHLLQRLGSALRADVVVLDALDIAELVCDPQNSSLSDDIADDRRLLSYDIYRKEDNQANESKREDEPANEADEQEGENYPEGGARPTLSAIVLDMKGLPFDLSSTDLSRGQRGQGQGQASQAETLMPGFAPFLGGRSKKDMEKVIGVQQRLRPLVETLLAGPSIKRATGKIDAEIEDVDISSSSGPMRSLETPLLLCIRDIRMLQRTTFGQRFLNLVYQSVGARRRNGQQTVIIGTDTFSKADTYSPESIRSMQSEPAGNISRTMVMTPLVPFKDAQQVLRRDKKRRIKEINMRHLWQMLCIKVPGLYEDHRLRQDWVSGLEDSTTDSSFYLEADDPHRHVWSFDYVHRLATMVVGHMELGGDATIKECLRPAYLGLKYSDEVKYTWAKQQRTNQTKSKPDIERVETERLNKLHKRLTRHEKKLLSGVVEPHQIKTTFDKVHAPLDTIDTLRTLTSLTLVRPDAFKYGILANDKIPGLLLYGPPGTGKTLLAKAVAKESGATVLEVSGADLNDKYVGEGEKNVKALFTLAKKLAPCVVFIDEADAIFSARGRAERRVSHRELLNQFLREWDGMSNDAGSAFIMVATNRPFDLDDAVLRRLPRRLLIDLPAETDRVEILRIHLREEILADDVNLADLASKTPFYSGSDLKNLSVAAALNCVREENERAKKHVGESAFEHAERRTLRAYHFVKALDDISASISEDMGSLKEVKKFDEQFGDKRSKKKKSPRWGFSNPSEPEKHLDTVKVRS